MKCADPRNHEINLSLQTPTQTKYGLPRSNPRPTRDPGFDQSR